MELKTSVYGLKGNDFSADAACAEILTIFKNVSGKNFCVVGAGNIGSKVALKLIELGSNIFIINSSISSSKEIALAINSIKPKECSQSATAIHVSKIPKTLDGVLGFTRGVPAITPEIIRKVKKNGLILDGGTGTISKSAIDLSNQRKLKILKLDIRMGFMAQVNLILNTEKLISEISGIKKINNFHIIAGGFYGKHGDVVVDNIKNPQQIIGIANGRGGLLNNHESEKFRARIEKVKLL